MRSLEKASSANVKTNHGAAGIAVELPVLLVERLLMLQDLDSNRSC